MNIVFTKLNKIQKSSLIFILPPNINYIIKNDKINSLKKFLLSTIKLLTLNPYIKFYMKKTTTDDITKNIKSKIKQIIKKFINFTNISSNKNNTNN